MGLSIGDFPLMQRMSSLRRARHLQLREKQVHGNIEEGNVLSICRLFCFSTLIRVKCRMRWERKMVANDVFLYYVCWCEERELALLHSSIDVAIAANVW